MGPLIHDRAGKPHRFVPTSLWLSSLFGRGDPAIITALAPLRSRIRWHYANYIFQAMWVTFILIELNRLRHRLLAPGPPGFSLSVVNILPMPFVFFLMLAITIISARRNRLALRRDTITTLESAGLCPLCRYHAPPNSTQWTCPECGATWSRTP